MRFLRHLALVVAVLALLAPAAHVLEMVNKLALDGPIWLAVQQQLYRGWGPLIGAPTEIAGLMLNAALAVSRVEPRRALWLSAGAALEIYSHWIPTEDTGGSDLMDEKGVKLK